MIFTLIITFIICLVIGLSFKLIQPIFEYLHYLIIEFFENLGISYMGARAIASIVIIIVILKILF